ncbi:MAG: DUF488 domain-containing protein, partial [Planctomycetota bacterium]|nr:DUF488 domain-containing protein [Planctomycetota bacterium]
RAVRHLGVGQGIAGPVQVWTVGHSNRTTAQFLAVLAAHGIQTVCDVRRFPRSRRHPQFDRAELAAALRDAGIAYRFLGETLGGYRDYEAHMKTPGFEAGLRDLLDAAQGSPCAFMCAEKDPKECHRRFIADHLVGRCAASVFHILDAGAPTPHTVQTRLF